MLTGPGLPLPSLPPCRLAGAAYLIYCLFLPHFGADSLDPPATSDSSEISGQAEA